MGTTVRTPQEMQNANLTMKEGECLEMLKRFKEDNGENKYGVCPPIWDELMCWNESAVGRIHTQPCPKYVVGFDSHMHASKECLENGTWYRKYQTHESWTDFSQCHNKEATVFLDVSQPVDEIVKEYLPPLKKIANVGYSISFISLLVAFTIIISIKKLRCPRNVLHMHLFASFIVRAFMSLLKSYLFVNGLGTGMDMINEDKDTYFNSAHQTNWLCKMLVSIWQYCIMANYFWILMEGLYLHNLIFLALFTDSSSITLYYILGWGLPLMFVLPWTLCRALLENHFCWTMNNNMKIFILIKGPITATIVINFVLFINIVRVLWRKLQASVCEETNTYIRWGKSTLVLIPLFGVHYMVFLGLQFDKRMIVTLVWLYCDQIFASFNGFLVALLYCFLNGEVKIELTKLWHDFSFRELLERSHLIGHNSIFSTGRFLGIDRQRRPRGSLHSSTSCTIDTYVHSCNRDRKRNLSVQATPEHGTPVVNEKKGVDNNRASSDCRIDSSEVKNGLSNLGKDRRWSASDCDLENNAVELKSMTSPDKVVKL